MHVIYKSPSTQFFLYLFSCYSFLGCAQDNKKETLNSAPEFSFFEVQPSNATTTDLVFCSYFAEDENNDPLTSSLEWKHLGTGQILGDQRQLQLSPNLVQPYDTLSCSVTVSDTSGLTIIQTGIVNIVNTPPIVENLRIQPQESVYRDQKLYCDANVYDVDGDEPNVFWQWLKNGESIGNATNNLQLDIDNFSVGDEITCSFKAVDQIPSENIKEVSVTIENAPPMMDEVLLTPTEVFNQNEITCSAVGLLDIDQDDITLSYNWTVNGIALDEESDTLFVDFPVGSEISCSITTFDGTDYGEILDATTSIQNTIPTITASVSPSEIFSNTKLFCAAEGSDIDPGDLTYSYVWFNENKDELGTGAELILSPEIVQPNDEITCRAIVEDADGGTNNVEVVVAITNTPPIIEDIVVDPLLPTNQDIAVCIPTITDQDAEPLNIEYLWSWSPTGIVSTEERVDLSLLEVIHDDVLECTVTVTDQSGATDIQSLLVAVANSTPTIGAATISPTEVYRDTEILCSPKNLQDNDGDEVEVGFQWTVDSVLQTETSNTLTGPFDVGSEVICTITTFDGREFGEESTTQVTVLNTPPTVKTHVITPPLPYADQTLNCEIVVDDVDGDDLEVTYQWTNQELNILGTQNILELNPEIVSANDELTCTVTIVDAYLDETISQATAIIQNKPPENISIAIADANDINNTIDFYVDTALDCVVGFDDLDRDDVLISYTWSKEDGTLLGEEQTLQLSPNTVSKEDIIHCQASINDGVNTVETESNVSLLNSEPIVQSVLLEPTDVMSITPTVTCTPDEFSDMDSDEITFSYTWFVDDEVQSETTSVYDGILPAGSTLTCQIQASDEENVSNLATAATTIINSPPVITSILIDPNTLVQSDSILTCSVFVDEPDDDPLDVRYTWLNQDGDILGNDELIELEPFFVFRDDEVTCSVIVEDPTGNQDSIESTVVVINTKPRLQEIAITPNADVEVGDVLTCTPDFTDINNDLLNYTYEWTDSSGNILSNANVLTLTSDNAPLFEIITCSVDVDDGFGGLNSGSDSISVGNTQPSIESVSIEPPNPTTQDDLVCVANNVTDPNQQPVSLRYQWTIDGVVQSETTDTLTAPFDVNNEITCSVTPNDSIIDGDISSITTTIINTNPQIDSVTINPNVDVFVDSLIECIAEASDVDAQDILSISYQWTNQDGTILGSDASLQLTDSTSIRGDVINCEATVLDDNGGSNSSQTSLTIQNSNPVFQNVSIEPNEDVEVGDVLTCTPDFTDINNDLLNYTYEWTDSSDNILSNANVLTLTSDNAPLFEIITCSINVDDGFGGLNSGSDSISVGNTQPSIESVSIEPPNPTTQDDLLCVANNVTDPNQQAVSLRYQWTIDGVVQSETTDTLSAPFDVNNEITCSVTPNDSIIDGDTSSTTTTIINTNPQIDSVIINPNVDVFVDSLIECVAEASDIDEIVENLSFSYQWTNQAGDLLGTNESLQLSPSTTQNGDFLSCKVSVLDSEGASDSIIESVSVVNTSPVIDSITLEPNTGVRLGDSISCNVTSSDINDDVLTTNYNWTNQDGISLGTNQILFLDPNTTSSFDDITCQVVILDGQGGSIQDSSSITIENTEPIIGDIEIIPNTPISQNDLVCTPSNIQDINQDVVTFSYTWFVNDVEQAETTDTLNSPFSVNDVIRCQALPNDGFDDGPFVEAIATIINTLPTIDTIAITPNTNIFVDSIVNCDVTASDIDGDTPLLSYEWLKEDGTQLGTDATLQLNPITVFRDDVITCIATATDEQGDFVIDQVSIIPINSSPVILSTTISPSEPEIDNTLTCSTNAVDVDSDNLDITYEWSNQTGAILGSQETLLLTSSNAAQDDIITCSVSVTDNLISTPITDSISVTVIDSPPILTSVSFVPTLPSRNDDITCEAEVGFVSPGDNIILDFEWTINGVVQSELSNQLSGPFSIGDTIICAAQLNGGEIPDENAQTSVTISNFLPTVDQVDIIPETDVLVDSELLCVGTASDLDGDIPSLSYEWVNQDGTLLGIDESLQLDDSIAIRDDIITCIATATDDLGESNSDQNSVTIGNSPPEFTDMSISPNADLQIGDTLTCSAVATDINNDGIAIAYEWTNSSDTVLDDTESLLLTAENAPFLEILTCTATAVDDLGGTTQDSRSVSIGNNRPEIESVTLDPVPTTSQDILNCIPNNVSDSDGDAVSLSFEWSIDDIVQAETTDTLVGPFDVDSVVTCSVTPNDGIIDGLITSASTTIINTDPQIISIEISPNESIFVDSSLDCLVIADDLDGETPVLTYEWSNQNGEILGTELSLDLLGISLRDDVITCTATATDEQDQFDTQSVSVTVENKPPDILEFTVTPSADIEPDDVLLCEVTSEDVDGDSISTSFSWTDNLGVDYGSSNSLVVTNSITSTADELYCQVTLTDGQGGETIEIFTVPLGNTPPQIGSVSLLPDPIFSNEDLLCVANDVTDANDDTIALRYEWFIDDVVQSEESDLLSGPFEVGNSITCRATAQDVFGFGDPVESSITVQNTSPVVESVSITPNADIEVDSIIQCVGTASDIDGDESNFSYEWLNPLGAVLATGGRLDLSTVSVSRDDTITCVATAFDSNGASTSDTASIVIINSAPELDSISVTPNSNITIGDSLTCSATATDKNNDSINITYAWSNQTGVDLGSSESLLLTVVNATNLDIITCTATVRDSIGATDSDTFSVMVGNNLPTIESVSLSPTDPRSIDDITCNTSGVSDLDGQSVSISYAWYIDDILQSETSNTLSAPFSVGNIIKCETTPNDGIANGNTIDTETTVIDTPASLDSVGITPSTGVKADTEVTCDASFTDIDGDIPTISYSWTNQNGTDFGNIPTIQLSPDTVYPADVLTCNVELTDQDGSTLTDSASITIENTLPNFTTEAIVSPNENIVVGTTLTCLAEAADLDDDSATVTYEWEDQDGNNLGDTDTLELPIGTTSTYTDLSCIASATDLLGGVSTSVNTVPFTNTPPTIDDVTLAPNPAIITDTTFICTGIGENDLDGDVVFLEYEWIIDDVIQSETTSILSLDEQLTAGTVIGCSVTPNDGKDRGEGITVLLEMEIFDPNTLNIAPPEIFTLDTAEAVETINTVEVLTSRFEWYVNGAKVENDSTTLDGVVHFDKNDEIFVIGYINEGLATETIVTSDTVTVLNSPPNPAPTRVIGIDIDDLETEEPVEGLDEVFCEADGEATDDDGDPVFISQYTWTVSRDENISISPDATLQGDNTFVNDIWTCTITFSDGEDTSTSSNSQLIFPDPNIYVDDDFEGASVGDVLTHERRPRVVYGVNAFHLISDALNTLPEDILFIGSGVYQGIGGDRGRAVVVRSPVRIMGMGQATYDANRNWTGGTAITRPTFEGGQAWIDLLNIEVSDVIVEKLTLDGYLNCNQASGQSVWRGIGIDCPSTSWGCNTLAGNIIIRDVDVVDVVRGVITGRDYLTFENVKMSRSSQGEAYYRSLDPDNDWAPFRYGFTFSGSRGVVLNDVEVYNTRGGLVLYDGENEVSVNNMLISGTGESGSKGIYILPTTTNPGPQDLSLSGLFTMSGFETGVHIVDVLSSPNAITIESSIDTATVSGTSIGIYREGTGDVIGLPNLASDLGFNNFTAGTPEFYNP